MKNINRLFFYFWRIIKIFLMWYGIVIVWIVSMYYKTLRSRVMFERILWNIYIYVNYLLDILVKCFVVIGNVFLSLQLIKNKKIFESKMINQKFFYISSKENFENRIINQKFFYESNEVNINFLELFNINLFKRSNSLWGFGKYKGKIISTICSSSPTILKKKMVKKYDSNNSNNNVNINKIVSNANKEIYKNYLLEYKIKKSTKNHPKITEIIVDDNADHLVVIGNLTTSPKNAISLALSGILYKDEVFVYNEIIIEKLDNEKLGKLKEIVKNNKDINYTNELKNLPILLNNLNNFIENKTKQKIFLKNEQIGIEEKIKRIEHYRDELDRMNSRED